jgi:hypothetical protein
MSGQTRARRRSALPVDAHRELRVGVAEQVHRTARGDADYGVDLVAVELGEV